MLVSCGNGQSWVRPRTLLDRQVNCDCGQHWLYSFLVIATVMWSFLPISAAQVGVPLSGVVRPLETVRFTRTTDAVSQPLGVFSVLLPAFLLKQCDSERCRAVVVIVLMWVGQRLRCWQFVVDWRRPVQLLLGTTGYIDGRVSSRIGLCCGHFTDPGSWHKVVVSMAVVIKRGGHKVAESVQVLIHMVMILYRAYLLHFLFGSWKGTVPTVWLLRGDGDLSFVYHRNNLRQGALLPLGRNLVCPADSAVLCFFDHGVRFVHDSLNLWFLSLNWLQMAFLLAVQHRLVVVKSIHLERMTVPGRDLSLRLAG